MAASSGRSVNTATPVFDEFQPRAFGAEVQHLRLFVHLAPDAMAAVFAHDRTAIAFRMARDRRADVAGRAPGRTVRMPFHSAW